jgi:hypothetical protein
MSRKAYSWLLVLMACAFGMAVARAQEPSLHDVYQAAEAGKLSEARRMMDKVLHDHPNSAKAHYVEAELLAKEGRYASAGAELATAERLQPGLPFANAASVRELKDIIRARTVAERPPMGAVAAQAGAGLPWTVLLVGLGVIALGFVAFRAMSRRAMAPAAPGFPSASNFGGNVPAQPYGPMGPGAAPTAGGGIGSGILGGLATGAALGAGMVAGEALMHRFTDGRHDAPLVSNPSDLASGPTNDNLGGNDFGVSDSSSWDDGAGAGGSDWS